MKAMGRRSDMENEQRPIEDRLVEIIASSDYQGIKFGDIVQLAEKSGISRATVARYLDRLVSQGMVKKDGGYKLAMEAVNSKHAQRSLFSVLAMHLFDDIVEKAGQGKLGDEEFTRFFVDRVGVLAMYTLLVGLGKAGRNPEEAGRWVEEAFGTLIQKDGWRMCLDRQLFRGVVLLRSPVKLDQPLRHEIEIRDETIYVHLPSAIQPGSAARVFKELPPISEDRLNLLKECLKRLYPKETELLDDAINIINEAVMQSKRR
jgi:DNA-binding transcriptional regulator YhcF (GntR family)